MLTNKEYVPALASRKTVNSHWQWWGLISTLPWFPNLSVCLSVCLLSSLKLCQINLEGKTFYSKKDKPLCKGHAFAPVWEIELHLQRKEHFSLSLLFTPLHPPAHSYTHYISSLPTTHLVKLSLFLLSCRLCFYIWGLMLVSHTVTLLCCQEISDVTVCNTKFWFV